MIPTNLICISTSFRIFAQSEFLFLLNSKNHPKQSAQTFRAFNDNDLHNRPPFQSRVLCQTPQPMRATAIIAMMNRNESTTPSNSTAPMPIASTAGFREAYHGFFITLPLPPVRPVPYPMREEPIWCVIPDGSVSKAAFLFSPKPSSAVREHDGC